MKREIGRSLRSRAVLSLIGLFLSGAALAEDANTNTDWTIETVTVTARKRAETEIKVPIAMTAISAEHLRAYDLKNSQDIGLTTPNLYVGNTQGGFPHIDIRGMGNQTISSGFAQSVGMEVDGLYQPHLASYRIGYLDLDRVEVLRGPQSTYFGKNTTAGLLNFVTALPGNEFEAQARAGYEVTTHEKLVEAYVSGPIDDAFSARLIGQYRKSDGWIDNLTLDRREPQDTSYMVRGTIVWNPKDNLTITNRLSYTHFVEVGNGTMPADCSAGVLAVLQTLPIPDDCKLNDTLTTVGFSAQTGSGFPDGFFFAYPDAGRRFALDEGERISTWSEGLTINYDISGGYTLTSVTGYQGFALDAMTAASEVSIPVGEGGGPQGDHYFSQEVRLLSPIDQRFSFVVGAYYDNDTFFQGQIVNEWAPNAAIGLGFPGLFPPFAFSALKLYNLHEHSFAFFGEGTLNITDELRVIVGGRYTADFQSAHVSQGLGGAPGQGGVGPSFDPTNACGSPPCLADIIGASLFNGVAGWNIFDYGKTQSFRDFSPSVTLQYDVTENGQIFGSFKEGFKAGGLDQGVSTYKFLGVGAAPISCIGLPQGCLSTDNFSYAPESVKAYELGAKVALPDEGVVFSAVLFREEFSDLQIQSFVTGAISNIITINAAGATAQGVELQAVWAPSPELEFNANAAYTDGFFSSYPSAVCYANQSATQGCDPLTSTQDMTGTRLSNNPKFQAAIGADWHRPVIDGRYILRAGTSFTYRDSVQLDFNNCPCGWSDPSYLLNMSIGIGESGGLWDLQFIGKNLADQTVANLNYPLSYFGQGFIGGGPGITQARVESQAPPATYQFILTIHY